MAMLFNSFEPCEWENLWLDATLIESEPDQLFLEFF